MICSLLCDRSKRTKSTAHPWCRSPLAVPPEITIGAVLGRGGFCTVSEISKVKLKCGTVPKLVHHDDDDDEDHHGFAGGQAVIQDRSFIAEKYLVRSLGFV
jgi:hypothetical protein